MSIYMSKGTCRHTHFRRLRAALDGIGFLTVQDLIELMGGDSHLCSQEDFDLAKADLHAMGYREEPIGLWGRRRVFWRWVKVAYSPEELASRWGNRCSG